MIMLISIFLSCRCFNSSSSKFNAELQFTIIVLLIFTYLINLNNCFLFQMGKNVLTCAPIIQNSTTRKWIQINIYVVNDTQLFSYLLNKNQPLNRFSLRLSRKTIIVHLFIIIEIH